MLYETTELKLLRTTGFNNIVQHGYYAILGKKAKVSKMCSCIHHPQERAIDITKFHINQPLYVILPVSQNGVSRVFLRYFLRVGFYKEEY